MTAARLASGSARLTIPASLGLAALLAGVLAGARPAPAAVAGGIAALGIGFGLVRPAHGLLAGLAVALLAPFLVVPQRLGVQPPILDAIVAATFLGIAVRAVQGGNRLQSGWRGTPRWLLGLAGVGMALPLAAGAAALAAIGDGEAAQVAVKMSLYGLTPVMVALVCWRGFSVQALAAVITAAAAVQAMLAIVLHQAGPAGIQTLEQLGAAGYPTRGVARFLPDQVTPRATGLLVDPNVLGVTLAAALPFALAWIGVGGRRRGLGLIAVMLIGVALVLTISRASWIAAAAGLLVWLGLVRPRLAALTAAALGAGVLAAPIEPFERIRQGLLAADRSAALRIDEVRESFRVIGRFPLLGVGYGAAPQPDIFAGVSNAWLWLAERAGVFAALAHLALLGGAARAALRPASLDSESRPLLASLVAFVIAGVFDHHIVSFPHLVYLLGGLAGLIVARAARSVPSPS